MKSLLNRINDPWQVWMGRLFIAVVLFWNLQCAIYFILSPKEFSYSFELSGTPGITAITGYGILFLMWQVPYVFALIHPLRYRISLIEAIIMQFIGVTAESLLLFKTPHDFALLRSSIVRFIVFDGAGVVILLFAYFITRKRFFP